MSAAPADLRIPDELSRRYRVLEVLGRGATSEVLRAEELDSGEPRVLKLLRPGPGELASVRERFLREAELLASLRHPHIIPLLGHGTAGELLYLTYPEIPGRTLAARIAEDERLDLATSLDLLEQVSEALAYLSARGVVHRDLKPENLLLREDGSVLVFDFGLSSDMGRRTRLTATGEFLGTPAYAAPEQILGRSADPRDDLYALGVLAYRLLTGHPPFQARGIQEWLECQLNEVPRPPVELEPTLPIWLSFLVMELLEKKRHDRPSSAELVLQRLQQGDPEESQRSSPRGGFRAAREGTRALDRGSAEGSDPEGGSGSTRRWLAPVALLLLGLAALGWNLPRPPGSRASGGDPLLALARSWVAQLGSLNLDQVEDPRTELGHWTSRPDVATLLASLHGPAGLPEPVTAELRKGGDLLAARGLLSPFTPWVDGGGAPPAVTLEAAWHQLHGRSPPATPAPTQLAPLASGAVQAAGRALAALAAFPGQLDPGALLAGTSASPSLGHQLEAASSPARVVEMMLPHSDLHPWLRTQLIHAERDAASFLLLAGQSLSGGQGDRAPLLELWLETHDRLQPALSLLALGRNLPGLLPDPSTPPDWTEPLRASVLEAVARAQEAAGVDPRVVVSSALAAHSRARTMLTDQGGPRRLIESLRLDHLSLLVDHRRPELAAGVQEAVAVLDGLPEQLRARLLARLVELGLDGQTSTGLDAAQVSALGERLRPLLGQLQPDRRQRLERALRP